MWLRNQRIQRLIGGGLFERASIGAVSRLELMGLSSHKDRDVVRLIRRTRRERRWLLTSNEAFIVYSLARAQAKRDAALAEVGTYQGGSARMICEAKGDRPLHVFDTFEGLPPAASQDGHVHRQNQYACSLESVKSYLSGYKNVSFYKGIFPDTSGPVENLRFSFAHFDVDLYEGTLACLEFFYPRMLPGGVMLSHDYSILSGVREAFAEFLQDKPEPLVELPTTQCMVVKLP
ncbi:MAG TPA: TylF/MycF/NovP-related O-methyltransferase [Pirellulales bacterium]|nr:TylF/MycF/NovP-related O-methyltransferase [Pirellulales bacterium]